MTITPDHRAASFSITDTSLVVELQDGRTLSVPISWFPALSAATPKQLADHRIIGDGVGIHWESIGVDLSVAGLFLDTPPASSLDRRRVSYHVVPADGGWQLKRQGEKNGLIFLYQR